MFSSPLVSTHRDADDLLSGGLGLTGLQSMPPPAFADAEHPTAAELRRRALWGNWRGIADLAAGGGYGTLYGSVATVPGREFSALATLPGGHLALHADFNRDSARHLDRVLTALYYVPTAWDEAWGGELELWDRARTRCEVRISPVRDRLVVMAHGEDTWHGHPQPLACPEGRMRAVVAAYFYAARAAPGDDDHAHGAVWA